MAIAAKTKSQTEEGHQDDSYFIDEYRMCAKKNIFNRLQSPKSRIADPVYIWDQARLHLYFC